MRPLRTSLLLCSFLAVFLQSSRAQEGVTDVVKRSSDAVVLIAIANSAGQETVLGSGFLISADGQIATNYHVIKDAHVAVVKLSNGAFFPVDSVLASDPDKDLAIIKVNGRNLPFLQIGELDSVHVGDHVVAIGSPLGLEGTVSDGIVSALRDAAPAKWIQTTAPVSHGNSGGPLLDMNDHVVGVITWGVNLQLGQNLNFAAPADEIKTLLAAPSHSQSFAASPDARGIQHLADVRKVAVMSLGNTQGADLVREKLINRIAESGKIVVVENSSDADVLINGAVGTDIYGRANSAAIRAVTKDGRTLWGTEAVAKLHKGVSTSASLADELGKGLITAIARDELSGKNKR
jgi:S1-C subfamily serine protease